MGGMHSPRRDLTIGDVGGGPSLANLIESQNNRSEGMPPSTATILENPLLGGGKKRILLENSKLNNNADA